MNQLVSGLVVVTGLAALGVGVAAAASRLRDAGRAYRKTETLYAAMPDGWTSWFVGGFSGLSVGTQWLWAAVSLVSWVGAGLCLIGLGVRLLWRS